MRGALVAATAFTRRWSSARSASSSGFVWIFPGAYLPRLFCRRVRVTRGTARLAAGHHRRLVRHARHRLAGRGARADRATRIFPRPHLVQFLAFSVIFTTLVFQGLTLPAADPLPRGGRRRHPRARGARGPPAYVAATFEENPGARQEDKFPRMSSSRWKISSRTRALAARGRASRPARLEPGATMSSQRALGSATAHRHAAARAGRSAPRRRSATT